MDSAIAGGVVAVIIAVVAIFIVSRQRPRARGSDK
jgi:hypothetical protein